MNKIIYITGIVLFLVACSKFNEQSNEPKDLQQDRLRNHFLTNLQDNQVQIISTDGSPVAHPIVYIGTEGFHTTADENGIFSIPPEWAGAQTITIEAPQYMRTSYLAELPRSAQFKVSPLRPTVRYEMKGVSKGYKNLSKDGYMDFAIVMKAFSRTDFLSFDLSMIVSPEVDTIQALGQDVELPSNISMPEQKESYLLVPVTLAKEEYRFYFNTLGTHKMYVAHARMDFKSVMKKMLDQADFYKSINDFKIVGGTLQDVNVTSPMGAVDFTIDAIPLRAQTQYPVPALAVGELAIVASVAQMENHLVPLDFKLSEGHPTVSLNQLSPYPHYMMAVKKYEKDMQENHPPNSPLSAFLVPAAEKNNQEFLALMESPVVTQTDKIALEIKLPPTPTQTVPNGMLVVINQVEKNHAAEGPKEVSTRYWEVYGREWQSRVELPLLATRAPAATQHLTVNLLSNSKPQTTVESRDLINHTTHMTSHSTDF